MTLSTGKSVIHSTISQFDFYMNKIVGIINENYIDTLLSRQIFSFKITKLSTNDKIFNRKPSEILCIGTLIKIYHLAATFTLSQLRIFTIKS